MSLHAIPPVRHSTLSLQSAEVRSGCTVKTEGRRGRRRGPPPPPRPPWFLPSVHAPASPFLVFPFSISYLPFSLFPSCPSAPQADSLILFALLGIDLIAGPRRYGVYTGFQYNPSQSSQDVPGDSTSRALETFFLTHFYFIYDFSLLVFFVFSSARPRCGRLSATGENACRYLAPRSIRFRKALGCCNSRLSGAPWHHSASPDDRCDGEDWVSPPSSIYFHRFRGKPDTIQGAIVVVVLLLIPVDRVIFIVPSFPRSEDRTGIERPTESKWKTLERHLRLICPSGIVPASFLSPLTRPERI